MYHWITNLEISTDLLKKFYQDEKSALLKAIFKFTGKVVKAVLRDKGLDGAEITQHAGGK